MLRFRSAIAVLLIVTPAAGAASAADRVALVIGNQGYVAEVGPLKNPHNDIRIVGAALTKVGFELMTPVRDATRDQLLAAVHDFADRLQKGGPDAIGFLYYAGHGVAVGNDNVLVPINVKGTSRRELEISGVRLGEITTILNETAPQAVHFIVFDACRNLAGGRGARGFVPMAERPGMLIAFSTSPGTPASDEGKDSGPYAAALASELVTPGRYHGDMFFEVRTKVSSATGQEQIPWTQDGLLRRVHFAGEATAVKPVPPQPALEAPAPEPTIVNVDGWRGWRLVPQIGHTGSVLAVALWPDGRTIASAGNGTLHLWDATSGHLLRSQESSGTPSFAPDGRMVATRSYKTVKLWDVTSGTLLRSFEHKDAVWAVAVMPDGRTIVSGGTKTVGLWEAASGALLRSFEHKDTVRAVAVVPDGRTIVSGGKDKTVRVWDAVSGTLIKALEGHKGEIITIAVTADGRTIVSGGKDKTVRVWDAVSGTLIKALEGHKGEIAAIAVTADGRTIVSGGKDNAVRLWDAASGRPLLMLEGHKSGITALALGPDGRTVITGGADKTVRLWDATSGRPLQVLEGYGGYVHTAVEARAARTIVTASNDELKLWDAASCRLLRTLEGHTADIAALEVAPDGRTVASASNDQTIKLWDATKGGLLRTLKGYTTSGHALAINSVDFILDGRRIISQSKGFLDDFVQIKVWDVESGRQLLTLEGYGVVVVAPDGRMVVSALTDKATRSEDAPWANSSAKVMKVWDATSGRLLHTLTGHKSGISAIGFLPGGQLISHDLGNAHGRWDLTTGRLLKSRPEEDALEEGQSFQLGQFTSTKSDRIKSFASNVRLHSADGALRCTMTGLPNGLWVSIAADDISYTGPAGVEQHLLLVKDFETRPVTKDFNRKYFRSEGFALGR